jgi:methyltransferase (TIGR00027 family)
VPLLGEEAAQAIRANAARHRSAPLRALRSHVCLRSRVAEDRLAKAAAAGVRRYVLVGAGFDTFALRQPAWAQALQIIEVDHPATQAAKREILSKAGHRDPDNLIFASADFTRETLDEVLARHHVGVDRPACFSWLGVTMYLEVAAVEASLRAMSAFAPGSEVILTFRQPPGEDAASTAMTAQLAETVAKAGEAFVSLFTLAEMEALLRRCGFDRLSFLTPDAAQMTYFTPPRRDLPAPKQINIVYASTSGARPG